METDPFEPFLAHQGFVLLDGGLATALEIRGQDLDDDLWSARVLLEAPDVVRDVHLSYLEAGADCIATVTYQATFAGFAARGLREDEAEEAFLRAVHIATDARDAFWAEPRNRTGRLRPLVAASIGPYGAYLADGSEYTGSYDLDEEGLRAFHRRRWELLAGSGADLLACETIPSAAEARVLSELLAATPGRWAWISFQCRDGERLADGTPLTEAVGALEGTERLTAVGVNCVPPAHVPGLLGEARRATTRRLIAYPNAGDTYDPQRKAWRTAANRPDLATEARAWHASGAVVLGGCCCTDPGTIEGMRRSLRAVSTS